VKLNPITCAVIGTVLVGFGVIAFQSDERPDILPAMAGCFEGPASVAQPQIRIGPAGEFVTWSGITTVSGYEDKLGLSLLPTKEVVIDRGMIWLDSGHPLLLRIGSDRQSFVVPAERGPGVPFKRVACS
jgi:hypothetical protein